MSLSFRLNVPPVTRGISLAFVTLTLLHAFLTVGPRTLDNHDKDPPGTQPHGLPFLVLVPYYSWKTPWVVLTAALVNRNPISLAVSCLAIYFGGRYFERAWGGREYVKFALLLAVVPNTLSACALGLCSFITGSQYALMTTVNGTQAFQAALLVAFKQHVPEHTVSLLKNTVRVRVKHFPALFVTIHLVLGVLSPLNGAYNTALIAWLGFLTSWIYLRFFRRTPSATDDVGVDVDGSDSVSKGDASDTFAFKHFFPDSTHAVVGPVCDRVYDACLSAGLVPPFAGTVMASGNPSGGDVERGMGGSNASGGGSDGRSQEAERRRALALRALEQKLAQSSRQEEEGKSSETAPVPAVDDSMTNKTGEEASAGASRGRE